MCFLMDTDIKRPLIMHNPGMPVDVLAKVVEISFRTELKTWNQECKFESILSCYNLIGPILVLHFQSSFIPQENHCCSFTAAQFWIGASDEEAGRI